MAQGREPSPPAWETAMTMAESIAPAMGAWMMGISIFRRAWIRESRAVCIKFECILEAEVWGNGHPAEDREASRAIAACNAGAGAPFRGIAHQRGSDWREGCGFAAILRKSRFGVGSADD